MFCGCVNDNECNDPNTLVCPVCLGYPGTLPVINQKAVELAAKTALSVDCRIQSYVRFDRKNYFYPDLPKGYQITQFFHPIGLDGKIDDVRIERVHLEEDTAKMIHAGEDSLIDFNRAGIPLLEIVSHPDINQPQQAGDYLKKLRQILLRGKFALARMQLGEFRCDANISTLNEKGEQLGEVVEIKNLNSFRNVVAALEYEHHRQVEQIVNGEKIIKETRGFDVKTGETYGQRVKEKAHDYRYFPEPDLPPLEISDDLIVEWRGQLGLSAEELREQLRQRYDFSDSVLRILVKHDAATVRHFLLSVLDHKDSQLSVEERRRMIMFVLEELWVMVKKDQWSFSELEKNIDKLLPVLNKYARRETDKTLTIDLIDQVVLGDKKSGEIIGSDLGDEEIVEFFKNFIQEHPEQVDIWQNPDKQNAVQNFFIGFVKRNNQGRGDVERIVAIFQAEMAKL